MVWNVGMQIKSSSSDKFIYLDMYRSGTSLLYVYPFSWSGKLYHAKWNCSFSFCKFFWFFVKLLLLSWEDEMNRKLYDRMSFEKCYNGAYLCIMARRLWKSRTTICILSLFISPHLNSNWNESWIVPRSSVHCQILPTTKLLMVKHTLTCPHCSFVLKLCVPCLYNRMKIEINTYYLIINIKNARMQFS